jgi:tRNA (adenine57-N1/adenine58-N1)-methyltransferase
MIAEHDRVIISGAGREYFVRAGSGRLSTDKGIIDLGSLIGAADGDVITTHLNVDFILRIPRAPDFFRHARRTGAPMLPKDIGMVIAGTGMNRKDRVLDAGTGSGVAAIFFGGIAGRVISYEIREDFARIAESNIMDAKLDNVEIICDDVCAAKGPFDVVHLDMQIEPNHIHHAHEVLSAGGFLATYSPFLEQTFQVIDCARDLFFEVETHELMDRTLTRTQRGSRPSTRICHSGYVTIARK